MALLQECPECKYRSSIKKKRCKCGRALAKASGKNYWIEYYVFGKRKRERIGPNKLAAEQREREVKTLRTEDRYIDKNKNVRITFDEVAKWYLQLPQIKIKRSYERDTFSVKTLSNHLSGKVIKDLTINQIESYRQKRLLEESRQHKHGISPATVNRKIACLRHMLNLAEREGIIESVPLKGLKALKENNVRTRILSPEEYDRLVSCCPPHTAQIVKMAYYTGMRQGEILKLMWDRVDLKDGFIHLKPEDTKTDEGRSIPLSQELIEMLKSMPRTIHGRVFTMDGKPINEINHSFATACKKAKIEKFTFHDLRHTCINNWRLQGNDYFRIMAASGHRTMNVFKRYNTVTQDELKKLISGTMDTYMDTRIKKGDNQIG